MAQGSDLDKFIDFSIATREAVLSGPNEINNQASVYRRHLFALAIRGLTPKKIIQAGAKIIDFTQLDYTSTFRYYNPTDDFQYTGTNSLTRLEVPWRFMAVHSTVYRHEIELQSGSREDTFKSVRMAKENDRALSWFEGMEKGMFALPNYETMESPTLSGTGQPYSLRCFITRDGLYPSSTNGGVAGADFSTLMTVPNTKANWRNQVSTFTNTNDASRRSDSVGVIPAMDEMWLKCQFDSVGDVTSETSHNKMRILANLPSSKLLVSLATTKNNVLTPKNDIGWASGSVMYHGIPVLYVSALDSVDTDAASPVEGGTAQADDGTGKKGFSWWFVNFAHFRPIFHSGHYREIYKFEATAKQPHARVMFDDTWHNWWCENRRENGMVVAA